MIQKQNKDNFIFDCGKSIFISFVAKEDQINSNIAANEHDLYKLYVLVS